MEYGGMLVIVVGMNYAFGVSLRDELRQAQHIDQAVIDLRHEMQKYGEFVQAATLQLQSATNEHQRTMEKIRQTWRTVVPESDWRLEQHDRLTALEEQSIRQLQERGLGE